MSVTVEKILSEVEDFVAKVGEKRAAEGRRDETAAEIDANYEEGRRLDALKTTQEHEIAVIDATIADQESYLSALLSEFKGGPAAGTDPTPAADGPL